MLSASTTPDHVGHQAGHDTPEYYAKLKELDGYVGRIIQAVTEAGMLKETTFIVTADHGGIEKGHGGKTNAGNADSLHHLRKGHKERRRIPRKHDAV